MTPKKNRIFLSLSRSLEQPVAAEPEDPNEPVEPDKPVEPEDPDEPLDPNKPVEPEDPDKPVEPRSDESFNMLMWLISKEVCVIEVDVVEVGGWWEPIALEWKWKPNALCCRRKWEAKTLSEDLVGRPCRKTLSEDLVGCE